MDQPGAMDQVIDFFATNRWVLAAAGFMTLVGLFAWLRGLFFPAEQAASRKDVKAVTDAIAESRRFAEQTLQAVLAKSNAPNDALSGRLAEVQAQIETIAGSYQRLLAERQNANLTAQIDVAVTEARAGVTGKAAGILKNLAQQDEAKGDAKDAAKTYAQTAALLDYTDPDAALEAYKKVVALEPENMDAWLSLGHLYSRINFPRDAKAAFNRAREAAIARGDNRRLASALHGLGKAHRSLSQDMDAERVYRECLAIAEKANDRWNMSAANTSLGIMAMWDKKYADAEKYLNKAAQLSNQPSERASLASVKINIGLLHYFQDHLDPAEKALREGIALSEETDQRSNLAASYGNLGLVLHKKKDLAGAEQMFSKSLEYARAIQDALNIANQTFNLAKLRFDQGRKEDACKGMRRSVEYFKALEMRPSANAAENFLRTWQCG